MITWTIIIISFRKSLHVEPQRMTPLNKRHTYRIRIPKRCIVSIRRNSIVSNEGSPKILRKWKRSGTIVYN